LKAGGRAIASLDRQSIDDPSPCRDETPCGGWSFGLGISVSYWNRVIFIVNNDDSLSEIVDLRKQIPT